ncbi:hypothetical protein QE152_g12400 [Popillia japonica]|uniref:Uncharacterized protein n=1 Tax=Popillia japonica TaxID=7064 RepID=A0AAW1LPC0_POPJA
MSTELRHPARAIENQSRRTIDTRTYRGAQAETDHHLVIATIRSLELKNQHRKKENRKRWQVELLENQEIRRRWEDESSKVTRDQVMISEEVDEVWQEIRTNITETAEEILDRNTKGCSSKDWFDQEWEEARMQKNLARVEWINTRQQQKRKEYEITSDNGARLCNLATEMDLTIAKLKVNSFS